MRKITLFLGSAVLFSLVFSNLCFADRDNQRYLIWGLTEPSHSGALNNNGITAGNMIALHHSYAYSDVIVSNQALDFRISDDLPKPQDYYFYPDSYAAAVGINDSGTIAGNYTPDLWGQDRPVQPFIWNNHNATIITAFSGAEAVAINNSGSVLVNTGDKAFTWEKGSGESYASTYTGLKTGVDINNSGAVLGKNDGQTAVWHDLDSPIKNIPEIGSPVAINDSGQVVGMHNGLAAIRDENGTINDIGQFSPLDINNSGAVVGTKGSGDTSLALLWDEKYGLRDLNELLSDADQREYQLFKAFDINEVGQVLAYGKWGDPQNWDNLWSSNVFVLTPTVVPEPASMFLFGLGAAALVFRKKRKIV